MDKFILEARVKELQNKIDGILVTLATVSPLLQQLAFLQGQLVILNEQLQGGEDEKKPDAPAG